MKLLLDTHVWVWSQESPERLGPKTTSLVQSPSNIILVSTISTLELAQLLYKSRISMRGDILTWVRRALDNLGAETVEITHQIAILAYGLSGKLHPDPADRILIASASVHDAHLLTADERILEYPHVKTINALR